MFNFFENPDLFNHKPDENTRCYSQMDRKLLNQGKQFYERAICGLYLVRNLLLHYEVF